MSFIPHPSFIELLGFILFVVVLISTIIAQRNDHSPVDLFDLVSTGGKLDPVKFMVIGAWGVVTLHVGRLMLLDKLSDSTLSLYLASCFGPVVVQLFRPPAKDNSQ
jgi:hypothetical protein